MEDGGSKFLRKVGNHQYKAKRTQTRLLRHNTWDRVSKCWNLFHVGERAAFDTTDTHRWQQAAETRKKICNVRASRI
jgi:hypothetical protein